MSPSRFDSGRRVARPALLLLLLIVMCGTVVCGPAIRAQQARWIKLAPFPDPCPELIGASANGKLFVFGGLLGPAVKGLVYVYDPAANTWTKKKNNLPLPAHHVMAVGRGDKVYLFGGGGIVTLGGPNWVPLDNSWEYDTVHDTWKALAPMPTARGAGIAALVGNKIYVIGGGFGSPGRQIGEPHSHGAASLARHERGLRHLDEQMGKPLADAHRAQPHGRGSGEWENLRDWRPRGFGIRGGERHRHCRRIRSGKRLLGLRESTHAHSAQRLTFATYAGKIYVIGGEYLNSLIVGAFRDIEAYDPAGDSWSILPPMDLPRNAPASAVIGNRLYIVSGQMQSGSIGGDALASSLTDALEFTAK